MTFLEKDLEQIIHTTDNGMLQERGLYIQGSKFRQVRLYGGKTADIVIHIKPRYCTEDKKHYKGTICVMELKQDNIGVSTFMQALEYLWMVRCYLQEKGIDNRYNYAIIAIGKRIDNNSAYAYLPNFTQSDFTKTDFSDHAKFRVLNYTYSYDFDGIKFNFA